MIVLDDGMQNNTLHRDFTIMVVDGKIGFGNGFMLPAGPLREPVSCGLKKADLVVVVGSANEKLLKKFPQEKIVRTKIVPKNLSHFLSKKLIAFCGLAYPEKFFSYLRENGLQVIETHSFPDHYHYSENELIGLLKIAEEKNAELITTKKDWVKFPKFHDRICHLDIDLEFENKELIKEILRKNFCKKKH
jgi:tetraacyldisaccharide 4'-kinase